MKALIYLPHSCVIFVAIVSIFLLDDRWSVPRPYRKPKSWRIGGSSWKFKMLWFFFFLLLNPPFVYVLLSRRWSIPLEDLTSKEKDPHFWWEAFAPLFGRVDCGFSQVCLLKNPSSRATRWKPGSSGCGRDSRASSRVETGMSGPAISKPLCAYSNNSII